MLLRLIPPAPLPTILFTLSFPTLPQSLPLPASWDAHLQLLADTQLASPPSLHALDKSVAWTDLLDTVSFDLATLTVTCIFIDGIQEEWPLTNRCVDLLESVIGDVNRSAVEADREREPTSPGSSDGITPVVPLEEVPSPPPSPPPKASKPKKRRSLIAAIMASLVPSSSSSASSAPPSPTSRPPTPPPLPLPPLPPLPSEEPLFCNGILASRFLRRRARSTLVDAFRRFVISELAARFRTSTSPSYSHLQPPQYALWAAQSTMRRAADEMAHVIEGALHTQMQMQAPAEDRDEDDGSASSMTDGSSVHTPLDSHNPRPGPGPGPGPALLAPETYHAYVSLKALHQRLHEVVCRLTAHAGAQELAAVGDAEVLEVRSRRRAWSTKMYVGGARMGLVGLAVPVRRSPLCQAWTPEDMQREREREREWGRGGLLLRRARSLWEEHGERERRVSVGVRSREAEDVDELARDVAGRLAFGDGTRVGYYEVDEDEEDEEEFELNPARGTRLVELARPTSPPLPWGSKSARAPSPVAAIEDDLPVSAKLSLEPDPASMAVI